MKTKQLSIDALLAAMCAVLGYFSLDFINLKITFEGFPVLLGALLFGPVDGMLIGGIGTLIYQIIRYGVTATTPLWILPYVLCGLVVGAYSKKRGFKLKKKQLAFIVLAGSLLIFLVNTAVMYLDSKIYGYYSFAYIFGTVIPRALICVGKSLVYAAAMPALTERVKKVLR